MAKVDIPNAKIVRDIWGAKYVLGPCFMAGIDKDDSVVIPSFLIYQAFVFFKSGISTSEEFKTDDYRMGYFVPTDRSGPITIGYKKFFHIGCRLFDMKNEEKIRNWALGLG